jgi:hypothetical protein
MSGAQHTPAPWRIGLSTEAEQFLFGPDGEVVCAIKAGETLSPEEHQKHLRLIAAAPRTAAERDELPAALWGLMRHACLHPDDMDGEARAALETARAAVLKVEVRS